MGFAAVVFAVMLLSSTPMAFGASYTVDWTLGTSYSSWTTKPLNEGDTLVFNYDSTHTVVTVSQTDFTACDSSNPISNAITPPTTITLGAGTTYIICGTLGHCAGGMKLQVTAKAASSSGGPPSTTPAAGGPPSTTPAASGPPSTPSTGTTTPSTPAAPTPSGNGAVGSLLSGSGLSLWLGLGATLVAFLA